MLFCASMACVMTSSPTRLISWSTFSTETRSVVDSTPRRLAGLGAALRRAAFGRRLGRGRASAAGGRSRRRAGRVVEEAEAGVGAAPARRRAGRAGVEAVARAERQQLDVFARHVEGEQVEQVVVAAGGHAP